MARNQGSVRMGPTSLFALVIILCMVTLSVLCVATAQASYKMSERQAQATTAAYDNERAAQVWMAAIGEGAGLAEADRQAMREAASVSVDSELLTAAQAIESANAGDLLQASSFVSGAKAQFQTDSGRVLDVVLGVRPDGSLQVLRWSMTAVLAEEPVQENLWSGM